jgi:hypothetical protein
MGSFLDCVEEVWYGKEGASQQDDTDEKKLDKDEVENQTEKDKEKAFRIKRQFN